MARSKASDAKAGGPSTKRLKIVRIFDASRARLFEMWSTPASLQMWSAPKGFTIPEARTDFREGGSWYAHMRSPEGEDHRVQGKYLEIVDGTRIVMTHAWLDERGNPGPETRVTVIFEDCAGETYPKTKMTFLQEGFTSKASRDGHADGWSQCFDLLEAYLASVVKSP